jgi:hypothetical protein
MDAWRADRQRCLLSAFCTGQELAMSAPHLSAPFRHIRPRLLLIGLAATLAGIVMACSESPPITLAPEPTRTDVIEAVRRSVTGTTYAEIVYEDVSRLGTCTQIDVDFDPYMPHNPELARCPAVGHTYTEWDRVANTEVRSCPTPPEADAPGWYVEPLADGRWRVSQGASSWTVTKLGGGAVGVADIIGVAGFRFEIAADQAC